VGWVVQDVHPVLSVIATTIGGLVMMISVITAVAKLVGLALR
jgi:hypothetical protein